MSADIGIRQNVTPQYAVEFLNELTKIDKTFIRNLVNRRYSCNEEFAQHPTVQSAPKDNGDGSMCGFLGVLNGLFGVDKKGWGCICAVYDVDEENNFKELSHFEILNNVEVSFNEQEPQT